MSASEFPFDDTLACSSDRSRHSPPSHASLDERQALEDLRAILALVINTMDPNARLDLEDRSTLAWLLRKVLARQVA